MKRRNHFFPVVLLSSVLVVFLASSVFAQPLPEGTVLASFDSGISGVGMGFDGQYFYVPGNIDSNVLYIFDTSGNPRGVLPLTCTIGNLSYDATRNVFWAGDIGAGGPGLAPIFTIDPNTGVCTFQFDAYPAMFANGDCGPSGCHWPFDGIDYDERDDTIRISPDASTMVYEFNTDGTLASTFGPVNTSGPCGFNYISGVATGQSAIMYTATDGCPYVFKWDKDTGLELNHFLIAALRNEAMECDNVTFRGGGNDAIWVKDLNGPIQAFAVPENTCEIIPEPTVEKFYTYTNNNWAQRCAEYDATTGDCISYRLANVNLDDDIFAPMLPKEDNTFLLYGQEKRKKTVVTPGQYIAVSVVEVPLERDITVVEDFSNCTDIGSVAPNKVPGGVQVVLVDSNGDVHDIDDDLAAGIGGWITLDGGTAVVHVEDVPAKSELRVMVKFQPNDEKDIIGDSCTNVESLFDDAGDLIADATAELQIVEKP